MKDFFNKNAIVVDKAGKLVFLAGLFAILMTNWNVYSLYTAVEHYNLPIYALLISVLFICTCIGDIKALVKDKLFYIVVAVNAVSLISLLVVKTPLFSLLEVFCISLSLYLVTKVRFSKLEIIISSCVIAVFFIYWTVDVKGYFKGYSINLGGEILISGVMFAVFLIEYLRHVIVSGSTADIEKKSFVSVVKKYVKSHQFVATVAELLVLFVGYKIIDYYQSRTGFFCLCIFVLLLMGLKISEGLWKPASNSILYKIVIPVFVVIAVIFMAVTPIIYVSLGNIYQSEYAVFMYKPLFSDRFIIWPMLWQVYKMYPLTGIGTLYMSDAPYYRDGLLDTCNSFLNLLVVHGPIVCAGVIVLLIVTLLTVAKKLPKSHLARVLFVIAVTMITLSYSENYIMAVPFIGFFFFTLAAANSLCSEESPIDETAYVRFDIKKYIVANKEKVSVACMLALLMSVMYFILGPLEIFYSNYDEFNFKVKDFIPQFIGYSIIISLVVILILQLLDGIVFRIAATISFAYLVASYVQYMFFNSQLMNADGSLRSADSVGSYAYTSLIPWIVILAVSFVILFVLKDKWATIVVCICAIISAVQVVAIISLPLSVMGREKDYLWLSGEKQNAIAKGNNIILIEADTFCREYLDIVLEEYPDAVDFLHDFTYFEDANSYYTCSYMSIERMLTQEDMDDGDTRYEREVRGYNNDTFTRFAKFLHDNDYTFNLFSKEVLYKKNVVGKIDNVEEAKVHLSKGVLVDYLSDMSVYRYVPYLLKSRFETNMLSFEEQVYKYDGVETVWRNSDFNKVIENLYIDENMNNAVLINHFIGMHVPYVCDENGNDVEEGSVPKVVSFRGAIKTCENYIDKLKELGKYDDSMIVVLGDHGHSGADSVLYVKRPNEHHDISPVVDRRVYLSYFDSTVVKEIGGDYKQFGDDIWE